MYKITLYNFSRICTYGLITLSLLSLSNATVLKAQSEALPVQEIQELVQVLELIKKNHVTAKTDQELLLAAINGMLASLDNQSRYLSAEELALFTRVATGKQHGKATTQGRMLADDIAYIDIDYFHASTADTVRDLWLTIGKQASAGLIIDLRDNPGGFVESAVAVADLFVNEGLIASSRGRVPQASRNYPASESRLDIQVPIIVLVDTKTASAAEIVAAALQDYTLATLVGRKTFGKGSIQSLMNTKYGAIQLTTSYYYTPKGRMIHHNGLTPDILLAEEHRATVAEAAEITYHQSENNKDWQLSWVIMAIKDNLIGQKN